MNEIPKTIDQAQNPFVYYQSMRKQHPVFYAPEQEVWLVFRYADVERVLTDYHTFSSRTRCCDYTTMFPSFYRMDPPELQQYRGLISQVFTPLAVERLAATITAITTELLDRVMDRGQMDVVDDLAFPLPLRVMAELLGLPVVDYDRYAAWSKAITGAEMPGLRAYFLELITHRRRALRPGIISSLLEASIDGRPLTEAELLGFCGQLFAGANAEITPFLGNVVQGLIEHPAIADELRSAPELVEGAIEELLRYYPPIPNSGPRGSVAGMELGGQLIHKGQRVVAVVASANRDETVFADPERFDIRRVPNPHLSFSIGPHFCPGAHLSRRISKIVLTALLERVRDIQLAPGASLSPTGLFGVSHFPIVFRS